MLRTIQITSSLPFSFPVDVSAVFEPGKIAQLTLSAGGNQVVCGVSDGTCPIGIIDDMKSNAFYTTSVDEDVTVQAIGVIQNGRLCTATDIKTELINPNVLDRSFMSDVDVELIARNGVIVIPAGTELNFDSTGSGTPDAVRVVCNYMYQIPNVPGDDSTAASGRVTVWITKGIYATDQYETNVRYPLNANLFSSESGLFTTRQISPYHVPVGIVTAPPSSIHNFLEFLWLG